MSKETVNSPDSLDPRVKLAFDQRKYVGLTREEFFSRYTQDLTALSQEASLLHDINFTPTAFTKLNDHTLICPEYDLKRDISSYGTWDGFFEVQCSVATEAVRDLILHTERDGLIVWISPTKDPGKPFASRLNLYLKHTDASGTVVTENYGITWNQTEEYCLKFASLAQALSDQPIQKPFTNISDLRQTAMFIPLQLEPTDNVWQEASQVLPLPENIWSDIISGRARQKFDVAKEFAHKRAAAAYEELNQLGPDAPAYAYIRTGARSETYMADSGYPIGNMSDCDLTNTSVMSAWGSAAVGFAHGPSASEAACPEIKCAHCPWKPNHSQLAEISARKLTCCPDCGWVPGTVVYSQPRPQSDLTFAQLNSLEQITYTPPPPTELKVASVVEPISVDWIDYFFFPWVADTLISAEQVA